MFRSPTKGDSWQTLRRRAGIPPGALFDWVVHGLARLARLPPWSWPVLHGVEVIRDIPYGDSGRPEHRLDIYRPRSASGLLPAVLYIHGGAFVSLSKDTHWPLALLFARQGYLVCTINYRLAPRDRFPAALADCCAALGWLGRAGQSWGANRDQIILAGESAGANLATALALCTSWPRSEPYAAALYAARLRPLAVLSACGLLQVSNCERLLSDGPGPRWIRELVDMVDQYLPLESGEPSPLWDPLPILERAADRGEHPERPLPPFLISAGTRDPLIEDSRRLERALSSLGAPHQARYYPNEPHAFHVLLWRRQAQKFWEDTFAFLSDVRAAHAPLTASDGT